MCYTWSNFLNFSWQDMHNSLFFLEKKSEIWNAFTLFEKWKVNLFFLSLISRVKSEMKMPWNRDREWKVKWKCLKIEIESEKWIENASRSRSRSEISREFSRNFEKFLRIKKSRKFSNFVTNSFHLANFYFGIQQNAFGDGPWLRHVTCKAVWMDWVGNLWMHLCSDHCLVMLIKRKSESESFSVTFNLSLNLEVVKFICFHSLVTMTEWEPTNRSLLWGTYFTKMENEGKCVACYKVLQCKGGNTVEPQIRSSASHCPSLTRNAYFTLFSREKRVKFEMLSLFPRVKSEMKMPWNRDREWKVKWKCPEIEIEKWNWKKILENSRETRLSQGTDLLAPSWHPLEEAPLSSTLLWQVTASSHIGNFLQRSVWTKRGT